MRLGCLLLFCVATATFACQEHERFPQGPPQGGPGTGQSTSPDAGEEPDAAEASSLRAGSLCPLVDLRDPDSCVEAADLSGIVVAVQGTAAQDVTDVDGRFTLELPDSGTAVVQAAFGAPGFVPSLVPIDVDRLEEEEEIVIPVMDATAYASLLAALDVQPPQDTGSLVIHVTSGGSPVAGAQITEVLASFGVFYNVGGPQDWIENAVTDVSGAALVFGVNQPVSEFTAIDQTGLIIKRVINVPVGTDALTFVEVDFAD